MGVCAFVLTASRISLAGHYSREQFNRIRNGMTRAEVEQVMGGPPARDSSRGMLWEDDRGYVEVTIGLDDRVANATCDFTRRRTLLDRLLGVNH